MPLKLLNQSTVPPRPKEGLRYADGSLAPATAHWAVVVPQSDTLVEHGDFDGLVQKIQENLLANHHPVPYPLEAWVEELICKNLDPSYRGCTWSDGTEKRTTIGWKEAANFVSKVVWVMARDNRRCVPEGERQRRYAICLQCPALGSISGCKGCSQISAAAVKAFGAEGEIETDRSCTLCGCFAAAKCAIPKDILEQAHTGVQWAPGCWMLEP